MASRKEGGKVKKGSGSGEARGGNRLLQRSAGWLPAALGLYLLLLVFFAPVVFQGMGLAPAADMVASAGMYRMGEEAMAAGRFPLWNPTLFCGMPLFASLQYALFTYPPEYIIRALSYIFGGGGYRVWLLHYLLAGLFAFALARHLKCGKGAAWLAGAAYAFSPQLIVLADVGHGSKLMGMTWLPLIWLALDRLRLKPTAGRAVVLGVVFAVEILALHPQVAAYGAMLMAVYLVYHGVGALLKRDWSNWLRTTGWWAGAMLMSLALSAVLWVSVLDYARYSIRGAGDAGVAGGGVSWAYATGWSFHPLESITFLFPNFMGFGNQTYWGTVGTPQGQPFTHNPMYFGCAVLLLSILAVLTLRRSRWGFPAALGLTAWVLSFGKYLPLLYAPFYYLLPMFNKFRAPVMGQVLLLLAAAMLAGMGLQELLDRSRRVVVSERLRRGMWWLAGLAAGAAVVVLAGEGLFNGLYAGFVRMLKPETHPRLIESAAQLARPDAARVLGLLALLAGLTALALKRRFPWQGLAAAFLLVTVVDLWGVNRKLVTFTPSSRIKALFQPEGIVRKLQADAGGRFRIHPLDGRYRALNWWSYFGLESTTGYFGAKPADYQRLAAVAGLDGWGALYAKPELLDALNVRYIVSSVPLQQVFAELKRRGAGEPRRDWRKYTPVVTTRGGGYLYRNPGELPRARLAGDYRVVDGFEGALREMLRPGWNPSAAVLLDREPPIKPVADGEGRVEIVAYEPESVSLKVRTPTPKLLVLADSYYPSGWRAAVDGQPVEIVRADGVLRAVAVPAGEHSVEFRFKPGWFYRGLWVSIVSILLSVAVVVVSLRRSRRGVPAG